MCGKSLVTLRSTLAAGILAPPNRKIGSSRLWESTSPWPRSYLICRIYTTLVLSYPVSLELTFTLLSSMCNLLCQRRWLGDTRYRAQGTKARILTLQWGEPQTSKTCFAQGQEVNVGLIYWGTTLETDMNFPLHLFNFGVSNTHQLSQGCPNQGMDPTWEVFQDKEERSKSPFLREISYQGSRDSARDTMILPRHAQSWFVASFWVGCLCSEPTQMFPQADVLLCLWATGELPLASSDSLTLIMWQGLQSVIVHF